MLAIILLGVLVFLFVLHILINHNEEARTLRKIPGPREVFLLGNALRLFRSPIDLFASMREVASEYDGIYRFRAPTLSAVNIYNPQDIETVLSTTKHNEKGVLYKFLHPWLGEGLLVSKGSKWQQRRKILTPAFHFNILNKFCAVFGENARRLADALEASAGRPVDVVPALAEFTLHSICETAMGTRLDEHTTGAGRSYKETIYKMGNNVVERITRVYLHFDLLFEWSSLGRNQKRLLTAIHDFTRRVIRDRKLFLRENTEVANDGLEYDADDVYMSSRGRKVAFLDVLISAEADGLIDADGIREEVDTFMFEGHDTTASALTYCLLLLAEHPRVQENIFAELQEVLGDDTRIPTNEQLSKLRYLECCIKESLRLYPPVHFIARKLSETVQLSGYTVPAGIYCHIHIFDLHRREELFKDPLVFDPDRFLPENSIGRHPYAYIPFSAGPRNCIGQRFAMLEMKAALAAVLRRFALRPASRRADLRLVSDLVLRNSEPVRLVFAKRDSSATEPSHR